MIIATHNIEIAKKRLSFDILEKGEIGDKIDDRKEKKGIEISCKIGTGIE